MADQRINLTLGIRADINQAVNDINKLRQQLDTLFKASSVDNTGLPREIMEAANAAKQLQVNLDNAFNVNTGKIDLSKFNQNLKQAGMTLGDYQNKLATLGPAGTQAFNSLATAIQSAEIPLRRTNALMQKFFTGLGNTFMWTMQSNAIHAVQSALSSAFSYAQQLNKGLTDIAIVSDLNTQQLTEFAKTANRMAKELSASTSEVVSGALIYYQAGLSDEEVINRTETTIKLAQTSGESAEQISSYMTAIWNNFYDGSKSVEYYADAISYLGAVTAASNADIAEGMQAFSAVADTVGLSFEYGASALTLLRDVTQQSASTIGNSLKTIFARLSSVKQGETLEDGVDYTKYSQALSTVGVEVVDVNGELRNMDDILDDLSRRWGVLSEAQKVALAQTVGGVRQYNNLISLMDNYERFQELVMGAEGSTGYLQHQADEYAESWEAASNRARAAWEEFYQNIINDKFFISLKNIEAGFANLLSTITKGLGGARGVLASLSTLLMSAFGSKITDLVRNFAYNIGFGREELIQLQKAAIDQQRSFYQINNNQTYSKSLDDYYNKLTEYNKLKDKMTDYERQYYQSLLDTNRGLIDVANNLAKANAQEVKALGKAQNAAVTAIPGSAVALGQLATFTHKQNTAVTVGENFSSILGEADATAEQKLTNLTDRIKQFDEAMTSAHLPTFSSQFTDFTAVLKDNSISAADKVKLLQDQINKWSEGTQFTDEITKLTTQLRDAVKDDSAKTKALEDYITQLQNGSISAHDFAAKLVELRDSTQSIKISVAQFSDGFSQVTQGVRMASSALMSFNSLEALVTGGAKDFGQVISSLSGILLGLLPIINEIGKGTMAASGWIGIILAALGVLIKFIKTIIDNQPSLQKDIDSLNETLEEQNGIIKELTGSFSNLKSTISDLANAYNDLTEAAIKYGENSPQYLLALDEYNDKLDELEKKYGDSIFVDPNAPIRKINEDALAEAEWAAVQFAKLERANIQSNIADKKAELSIEELTYKPVLSADYETGSEGYYLDDDKFVSNSDWEQFYQPWLNAVAEKLAEVDYNTENVDLSTIPGWKELDDDIKTYITRRFTSYAKAVTEAGDAKVNFGEFAKSSGAASEIFDWAKYNNTGKTDADIIEAINKILPSSFDEAQSAIYKQQGIDRYLAEHEGYTYNEEKGAFYDKDKKLVENAPVEDELIQMSAKVDYLNRLRANDSELINQIVDNLGLSGDQIASWKQFLSDLEQFKLDSEKAQNLGLDASEFQEYVEYLKSIPEYAKFAQQELDEIAIANMRINRGVKSLADDYNDWMDVLENANKKGMEWAKHNIEYKNAVEGVKQALADIANVDTSLISDEFLESAKNLKLIEAASTGDVDAVDNLIHAIAVDLASALDDSRDNISTWEKALIDGINEVNFNKIEIGASIVDQPFYDALTAMVANGQIAADEINDFLASVGFSPIVDYMEVPISDTHHVTDNANGTYTVRDDEGNTYTLNSSAMVQNTAGETGMLRIPIIKGSNTGNGKFTLASSKTMTNAISTSKFTGGTGKNVTQSNKKGGSNKGGGSNKTKEKEIDRYHEINSQLEQVQHQLDLVNTAEGQAYGPAKLALMDEKIKLLEQEGKLYEELRKEAQDYYDADRARLVDTYGAQFNPDGSIANYDAWYQQFLDKYNSGAMDDDAWSAFEDAIKKYEDSLKHLNDAEKKEQDNIISIFNEKLEKIEYKLKYMNKLIDQDNEYLDFMMDQLDKNMYATADVLALMGQRMGNIMQQAENERAAIAGILAEHGLDSDTVQSFLDGQTSIADIIGQVGDLTQEEIDNLQQHQTALLNYSKSLIQMREEAYAKIGESIDEFNDKIERQIDIINDLDKVMGHYKNIVDIVGKDVLNVSDEMLQDLDQLSVIASTAALNISTDQLNKNKEMLEDLYAERQKMAETASEEDLRLMDEQIEQQEDEVRRLTENWASSWEEALKVAETAFRNSIERVTDAFGAAMAGSLGTLDNLQEAFDQQKQLNDRYLPMYQRIYELNKLTRDVNKAIGDTSNIAGKERLLKLQDEIVARQNSGAEITEYEVGMLQRRLELEQARIALEESQNAKNMVRMTRDNEGNWSYTYTADSSRTAEAEQNYEDKLYDLKKFNQESLAEFEQAMWKAIDDYKKSIADVNMTDEERAQKIKAFADEWVEHNGRMFQMAIDDAHWIIGEYGEGLDDLQDDWHDTISGHITDYNSLSEVMTTFNTSSATLMSEVEGTYTTWETNTASIFKAAGSDVTTFASTLATQMKKVKEEMVGPDSAEGEGGAVGKAKKFGEEMKGVFDDILTYIDEWATSEDGYFHQINEIVNKNTTWYNSINDLITKYGELTDAAEKVPQPKLGDQGNGTGNVPTPSGSGSSGGSDSPGGGGGDGGYTPVWTWTEIRNPGGGLTNYTYKKGTEPDNLKKPGWQWRKLDQKKNPMGDWYYPYGMTSGGQGGGGGFGEVMVKADTGMYTGSWGPEGKIAMLHEKELVLNKEDTANMLATVGFVRDITQMLSMNASVASSGLGNLMTGNVGAGGNYLDQNVTIHAEFPNATNHSEIEEAFNNLIGLASQYAGRKQ